MVVSKFFYVTYWYLLINGRILRYVTSLFVYLYLYLFINVRIPRHNLKL